MYTFLFLKDTSYIEFYIVKRILKISPSSGDKLNQLVIFKQKSSFFVLISDPGYLFKNIDVLISNIEQIF